MHLLGHFKYHIYDLKFEGREDETEYVLTFVTQTKQGWSEPQVEKFTELSRAIDRFQNIVNELLYRTSFADVAIYQQQYDTNLKYENIDSKLG